VENRRSGRRYFKFQSALIFLLLAHWVGGCGAPQPAEPTTAQPAATALARLETPDQRPTPTHEPSAIATPKPTAIPSPEPTVPPTPVSTASLPPEPTATESLQPAYVPIFEPADCLVSIPPAYGMECGFLIIPEDRSQPDGPTVRLPVAVIPSKSQDPAPDPVVHLVGGPGGNLLDAAAYYLRVGGGRILDTRDYILFNQRGTHLAEPSLECPDQNEFSWALAAEDLTHQQREEREVEYLLDCRDYLQEQGVNLDVYDSAAIAADVNDLRLALGYDQVNLYGISYGTRLALTVMRDYPQGIRSVILDSVYPPQVGLPSELALNADRAFRTLFEGCAADSSCNERYPNLDEVFYRVVDGLNAEPATVHLKNGTAPVHLDGDLFMDAIFGTLYRTDAIPWIPLMIYEASSGSYNPLQTPLEATVDESNISLGMHYNVQCREEVAFEAHEGALALSANLPRTLIYHFASPGYFAVCESWQPGQVDPVEDEPVVSDIPTLILSGQYDPITPPAWGRLAGETLGNSFFYEFPGVGHGVMRSNQCGLDMGMQFLADPTVEPDASCLDGLTSPEFN
jgi:pimeloyl-ACP methyl ester carboxylesterase